MFTLCVCVCVYTHTYTETLGMTVWLPIILASQGGVGDTKDTHFATLFLFLFYVSVFIFS
jgi:hypothetical protein